MREALARVGVSSFLPCSKTLVSVFYTGILGPLSAVHGQVTGHPVHSWYVLPNKLDRRDRTVECPGDQLSSREYYAGFGDRMFRIASG